MLIGLDPKTELIIFAQMLKSGKRYETNLNSLPNFIMKELIGIGGRPEKIEYRNPDITLVLQLFKDFIETETAFNRNLEPLGIVIISLIDELGKNKTR